MSVSYVIEYDDLDALIEGLRSVPNPSADVQRILLGAMLNRRNNDRVNAEREIAMLEASLAESMVPRIHDGPFPDRLRDRHG